MTEFVDVPGGRIACDVTGSGPLAVLSHGIGVRRQDYRFPAPMLAQAGYRVASADLRGHGESSMGWASITRTDVAGDLAALTGQLDGPAIIVGHSISGGAATIAAATRPDLVAGIVETNLFTKTPRLNLGALLRIRRYRRGISLMTAAGTGLADAALTGKGPGAAQVRADTEAAWRFAVVGVPPRALEAFRGIDVRDLSRYGNGKDWAYYEHGSGLIVIRPELLRPEATAIIREEDRRRWFADDGDASALDKIIAHEAGHYLYDQLDRRGQNAIHHALRDRGLLDQAGLPAARALSAYGRKDWDEAVAEGWSEFRTSPRPREVARVIGETMIGQLEASERGIRRFLH
jgi:pimeloyl-ACP methyl ester carboxylesterase